jgi:hypothetical protein
MLWHVQNATNLLSHCSRMAATADDRRTLVIDALSNKRDLRAAFADLAADVAVSGGKAMLRLTHPRITTEAIQTEWARVGLALVPSLRDAIRIVIEDDVVSAAQTDRADSMVPLAPPNYHFEVVRLLVEHALSGRGPTRLKDLISQVGSSKAPIVGAVAALRLAGVLPSRGPLNLDPTELGGPTLTTLAALPQVIRFRFERGSAPRTIGDLLERARMLMANSGPIDWQTIALAGLPAARVDAPTIDLIGTPRLDLVAVVDRKLKSFDPGLIRALDDGLEYEPNPLAECPVTIAVVRGATAAFRSAAGGPRLACRADVFLSLLDLGMREAAIEYARAPLP